MSTRRTGLGAGAEFRRIESLLASAGAPVGDAVIVGPGDDAAVIATPAGERLVLSCDLSIEGVHFRREWLSWEAIGWRAAASALSDLAAMGARPLGALLALAIAPELDAAVSDALARGVGDCLRRFGAPLLGGDLARSPGPAFLDVVVAGAAARPIRRGGAGAGDELWVTGRLGGAAAAAAALGAGLEPDPRALRSFERPSPRLPEIAWLAPRAEITAAIDLSDGLAGDAGHVAAASGARVVLDVDAIPLHPVLEEWPDREAAVRLAVSGGEDYELLLAAAPGAIEAVAAAFASRLGIPLTRLGRVEDGEGVAWVDGKGAPVRSPFRGFDHFAADGRGSP
ncbi:MAG: thiamine-phosphate kinase [Gemmatimonadota bacterium]